MANEQCKNCHQQITSNDKYCGQCGAKIVRERITFKTLIADEFWKVIGWDNRFIKSVWHLIIKPKVILSKYLTGTRKRYVNPIAFFAIGMTISLITFNIFQEHFLELSGVADIEIDEDFQLPVDSVVAIDLDDEAVQSAEELRAQMKAAAYVQQLILKYFNIYSFALLPLYAFVGFLVFRKQNNYTEHLVINAYIQGLTFLITTLFFLISLYSIKELYTYSIVFTVIYYSYAYAMLYELTFWKSILYILKFIAVLLLLIISFTVIMVIIQLIATAF